MDHLFFCLGMKYEYLGEYLLPNQNIIEHFFVEEQDEADVFEKQLIMALQEYGMPINLSKLYYDSQKYYFIDFVSSDIKEWFEMYYKCIPGYATSVQVGNVIVNNPSLLIIDENKIVTPTQKMSFLKGSFCREGSIGEFDNYYGGFTFANSINKFRIIGKLLKEMQFNNIEIIENAYGPPYQEMQSIPVINIIKIHPKDVGRLMDYH